MPNRNQKPATLTQAVPYLLLTPLLIVVMAGCRTQTMQVPLGVAPSSEPLAALTGVTTRTTPNLISDPGFESGLSDFYVDTSPRDSVVRSTLSPLFGKTSLRVSLNRPGGARVWGNDAWWDLYLDAASLSAATSMTHGKSLTVSARVRALTSSSSSFGICAAAAYADQFVQSCSFASRTVGTTVLRNATVTLDPKRPLVSIHVRLYQSGSASTRYAIDQVSLKLTYVESAVQPTPTPTPTPTPIPTLNTPTTVTLNFRPSDENMINPERGLFQWINLLDGSSYQDIRPTSNSSLVYAGVRLDSFRNTPLTSTFISQLSAGLGRLRSAGLKAVLRFQYNDGPYPVPDPDASKVTILGHLAQLKPLLQANADVIAVLQAGFIGAWGEGHSSTHGLEKTTDQKDILFAILQTLPPSLMTQIRVPNFKANIFASTLPIQEAQAFNESSQSRVGHHNDCFLASTDDFGTYPSDSVEQWKDYIAQDGRFTPVGGETCAASERTICSIATAEMKRLHYSYLNGGFKATVLDGWKANGCFDQIAKSLGYRIALSRVTFSNGVRPGNILKLSVNLMNVGYAAMFNHRDVIAVLDQAGSSIRFNIPLTGVDPRRWEPLKQVTLDQDLLIPATVPPGTYRLSLWLPDDHVSLRSNSTFSVKLAFQPDASTPSVPVWESDLGLNILSPAVVIKP